MNSGNFLNSLLGATSNIAVPNKNTAAKDRVDTNEKFRDAFEQARPNVAAPKIRKPEVDSVRTETSRTREDSRGNREPVAKEPAARAKPAARQAEKPASVEKADTAKGSRQEANIADGSKSVNTNEAASCDVDDDTEASLPEDDSSSAAAIDVSGNPSLVNQLFQQTPVSNDINVLPSGTAEEGDTDLEAEQDGGLINSLFASGETDTTAAAQFTQSSATVESPLVDTNADTETTTSLIPGQLAGVNTTTTAQSANTTFQAGGATNVSQLNTTTDQRVADAAVADEASVATEEGSNEMDATENPDFFTLLNAKTGISKLAESPAVTDKAIQLDPAKPALTSSPLVEPLTRLAEAQSPAARSFVAQTGVPVPVGQPQWSQAVGEKVLWLAAQNVTAAEIRLDPPDMGQLHVKVSVNQDQASVTFISPHPVVREALDQQLNRLREMFSDQGLNLVNVDVSDRSGAQQQQDQERSGHSGPSTDVEEDELVPVGATAITNLRLVDHYA